MPKRKTLEIGVYFCPGSKKKKGIIFTGHKWLYDSFRAHCEQKGMSYSTKIVKICQEFLNTTSVGIDLENKTKLKAAEWALGVSPLVRVLVARYMRNLKI